MNAHSCDGTQLVHQHPPLGNLTLIFSPCLQMLGEAHMAALEDAIRDAVRARRSVYEGSKDMLLKLFK